MTATLGKALRHPIHAATRARFVLASVAGHKDYARFIVLGHARTGSNMLLSMLNSRPELLVHGEVFATTSPDALHATVLRTFDRH